MSNGICHGCGATYVCIVELLDGGAAYDAATLNIGYDAVTPETATVADVVDGVGQVDAAMTVVGTMRFMRMAAGIPRRGRAGRRSCGTRCR